MKPLLKNIVIPAVSAIIGGGGVLAALMLSPALRSKLEGIAFDNQTEGRGHVYDKIIEEGKGGRHHFDSLFDDDLFGESDLFAEMKKMQEEMGRRMEGFAGKTWPLNGPLAPRLTDRFGGVPVSGISKREDDKYVYYDIKVADVKATSINTKVENGYITIIGTQERKADSTSENDDGYSASASYFKSKFNRTFPIPENVDANRMEVIPEKDKIVLKFSKLAA